MKINKSNNRKDDAGEETDAEECQTGRIDGDPRGLLFLTIWVMQRRR